MGPIEHDDKLCGLSPATSCPKCRPYVERVFSREAQIGRLKALAERMEKAGIDMDDFADVVWMRLQPSLEAHVRKVMLDTIQMAFRDLRITGRIDVAR